MMINHYRISLLAAALTQEAAMAHAYEHSGNATMAQVSGENAMEELRKIALELGYSLEKLPVPTLRAA
ncbi:hypothetical protein [Pseudochrobactrum saccharolyticum]|uniref:Uncharacterized protein n=1 Tax=Pseudochrobactrum saccharolyticum TaxID=354352 RepID=A0A7W8ALJ7_9HYPH|nr:hypothetical protein [Pseudochrobactrum saccharolyticum]KAB0538074.1 hypothetical protein F7P81_10110 [Pseudochrobactrum saccharolyticum]MBB5091298.1 hypothetical protein [Pseudochrobactrum saccharolyticum]MDP8250787.1 hypothetical protein [Pseudochrobactrum saccharolyticum]MDP8250814.1 hypothetical protein [Pseudochrobactrum saccharolyticum]